MVQPLSRNAVDAYAGVNTQRCSNLTGDKCSNGQAAFWYSQGDRNAPTLFCAPHGSMWFGHFRYRSVAMATPVLGWVPEPCVIMAVQMHDGRMPGDTPRCTRTR